MIDIPMLILAIIVLIVVFIISSYILIIYCHPEDREMGFLYIYNNRIIYFYKNSCNNFFNVI